MIRWISGQFEATYAGEPSALKSPDRLPGEQRYQLRVLRASVRDVAEAAPPADARPPRLEAPKAAASEQASSNEAAGSTDAPSQPALAAPPPAPLGREPGAARSMFRQARIDEAHVAELCGAGTFFLGALYDVRVSDVALSYATDKGGRAYGRMTGTVLACLVLPELPEPEVAPPSKVVGEARPRPAPGELHMPQSTQGSTSAAASARSPNSRSDAEEDEDEDEDEDAEEDEDDEEADPIAARTSAAAARTSSAGAAPKPPDPGPGLIGLALLVALALGLSCGLLAAALWSVFMVPTLFARRILLGVLPDSRGMSIFGIVLVVVQVVCVLKVLQGMQFSDCRELALGPLLGTIAVLFPAGLLTSRIPLLCNAAGLALVLFSWCAGC